MSTRFTISVCVPSKTTKKSIWMFIFYNTLKDARLEGNDMLSALAKYVINRLIYGLFHIALVISHRLISSLGIKPSGPISRSRANNKGYVFPQRPQKSLYGCLFFITH
jgi:hypothetical protein